MSGIQRRIVLTAIITLFICANLIAPRLFADVSGSDFLEFCGLAAVGGLVSEACLLATWVALGTLAVKFRLPLTGALVLVAACSFVVGLRLLDHRMPLDVAIIFICAGVAMYCCMQVPLWGMRAITRRRIDLPGAPSLTTKQESAQFGLRYLLAGTAVVGLLLVLVKHSLPKESPAGNVPWPEIIGGGFVFIAFSAIVCLPCVWLALSDERRVRWAVWLAVGGVGGPLIVFAALAAMFGPIRYAAEAIAAISTFGLGAGGTTLLVLFVVRLLGYRLVGPATSLTSRAESVRPV